MVTDGVDPGSVQANGDLWINVGNAMTRFQSQVGRAINSSQTDWQGKSGDSARRFMADVGNWVGTAGQSAQLAGTQVQLHSQAVETAKNTLPEPVPWDGNAALRDIASTTNPLEMIAKAADHTAQYDAHRDAHARAAEVVSTYDGNLGGASVMPAFSTPPTMAGGEAKANFFGGASENGGPDSGAPGPMLPGGSGSGGAGGQGAGVPGPTS